MARVLISMPEEFLNKIDQVADGENRSRSELIREALRTYIYKQKELHSLIITITRPKLANSLNVIPHLLRDLKRLAAQTMLAL